MKISERENEFVLRYFQRGKLDTQEALRRVKARAGEEEGSTWLGHVKAHRISMRWAIALAASFLLLLSFSTYTWLKPKDVMLQADSQVLTCHLPDGTQVTLAPHSSLSYQEDDCRRVEMTGCAYFQVKHDEEHPFDVIGKRGHVRVLGTQFQVDERTETPVVIVASGKVFFSARDEQDGVLLTKGEQARLLQGAEKPELQGECNVNEVAWATHQLHFDNTPLKEVLEELSKYNHGINLQASDTNKRLTGDFCTDSIPMAIQIIEKTLDVKITSR